MLQAAYFHPTHEAVQFWVSIDGEAVGARVSRQTLHYRYCPNAQGEDHLETYKAHAAEIDDAVRRRIAAGARDPVIVRDHDLAVRPA
jgi:hypothetical protein